MQNVAIIGQNAAEFVKIMPGMAFTGGVSTKAPMRLRMNAPAQVRWQLLCNGTRTGRPWNITSDGAHIIDPGCNCGQAMNTNADMTAELKVDDFQFRRG